VAREYKIVPDNPARGKNRRLKVKKAPPVWIDRAEHAAALLDAAGELDREAPYGRRHVPRRVMLATFVLAGLRIGELTGLRWRDVDLAANRITVRESKTDAGVRTVDLLPALGDALREYKASLRRAPGELVFPTSNGKQFGASNIRRRVLDKAVERANERLAEVDDVPLPDGLTPHKLRHTFCSVLVALGVDPGAVMDQMGHTDAAFTMRVYRHGIRRKSTVETRLARARRADRCGRVRCGANRHDWGRFRAANGRPKRSGGARGRLRQGRRELGSPALAGVLGARPARFERATFRSGGERSIP
jgi:integrase